MKYILPLFLVLGALNAFADEIVIQKQDGSQLTYQIEVATTLKETQKGLMFRTSLPPQNGMLFISPQDRIWAMWMKNTYIPLDMLFIARDGTITKITSNAQPGDLTPLESQQPVAGVLEINGKEAEKLNISVGDKVISDKL